MPLTDKGSRILENMREQYGEKRGKEVFYGAKNAGTIQGVDQQPALVSTPNAGIPASFTIAKERKRK